MPYLIAYLLFRWQHWEVNPVPLTTGDTIQHRPGIPCLLHLYWAFHLINLGLIAAAIFSGWQSHRADAPSFQKYSLAGKPMHGKPSFSGYLTRFAPWIALGLFFWIPGIYFEYPSDPWEHLSRINHWSHCTFVNDHYAWTKFSYFLAYSLIGRISQSALQFKWLNAYYTACCLLLCWQYYLLARALGFGRSKAMTFVIIQAVMFGNSVFSFYRYYGIASTIFAQIGAIAAIRLAVRSKWTDRFLVKSNEGAERPEMFYARSALGRLSWLAAKLIALVGVIALDHLQGLAIAGIGVGAVLIQRVIAWRRSSLRWLVAGVLTLSFASAVWWPRNPALDAAYVPQGWLTHWFGFNLLISGSPAFERAADILGIFGAVNLVAGIWLLKRNHVVGWVTVAPILALMFPFLVIPFANMIAGSDPQYIITFQRLLLGIPCGLALVVVVADVLKLSKSTVWPADFKPFIATLHSNVSHGILCFSIFAVVSLPVGRPFFNRAFNVIGVVPKDLQMRNSVIALSKRTDEGEDLKNGRPLLTSYNLGFVAFALGARNIATPAGRTTGVDPTPAQRAGDLDDRVRQFVRTGEKAVLLIVDPTSVFTPGSVSALLSKHWLVHQVELEYAGMPEIFATTRQAGATKLLWKVEPCFIFLPTFVNDRPARALHSP